MVVGAGAQEAGQLVEVSVLSRQRAQMARQFGLGKRLGQVERLGQADLSGNVREQLVDRRDADGVEHRAAISLGVGDILAHKVEHLH